MPRQGLAHKIPSSPDSAAVVGTALLRAADRLKVPARTVAKAVGLSESSVSRMGAGEFKLTAGTSLLSTHCCSSACFVRWMQSLAATRQRRPVGCVRRIPRSTPARLTLSTTYPE